MIDPDERFDDWLTQHQVEPLAPRPDTYERIARSARRRRTAKGVALAATLSVALVAVGGTAYRYSTAPRPVRPGVEATTPAPSVLPSPAVPVPSSPSPTAGGSSPATQISRCRTNDLRVTAQGAPGGGAAGNLYDWLVFTNISAGPCTLFGFPGVSYVRGPSGAQVNQPARRTSDTPHRITLNPQQSAHAQVHTGQPGNFPADTCKPVQVDGYRVYVPDETAAVFVAASSQQCSVSGTNVPDVTPIERG
jgi:hypothetical protein